MKTDNSSGKTGIPVDYIDLIENIAVHEQNKLASYKVGSKEQLLQDNSKCRCMKDKRINGKKYVSMINKFQSTYTNKGDNN